MDCDRRCQEVSVLEIVLSILLAIGVAVLYYFALIPFITTALWIIFGLAVLELIFLVAGLFTASIFRRTPLARCLYCRGAIYLAGIIGTIIMTLVCLSITLITTSILVDVLIGLVVFFAVLMTIELVTILCCIIAGLGRWSEN